MNANMDIILAPATPAQRTEHLRVMSMGWRFVRAREGGRGYELVYAWGQRQMSLAPDGILYPA